MELKTGDILICRGNGKLSSIIKKVTKSEWSHTAQILVINDKVYVIDAQKEGILLRNLEFWKREYEYEFMIYRDKYPISDKAFISNALQYCGLKYDFVGLATGLFRTIFNFSSMPDKYRKNGKLWCSEYTMRLLFVHEPEEYTPQRVLDFLVQNNYDLVYKNY
jgi:glycosyltransferase involved in cell wall biosynthesis